MFVFAPEQQPAPDDLLPPEPLSSVRQPRTTSEPEQVPKSAKASPSRSLTGPAWQQSLQQLRDAGVPNNVLAGLVVSDFEIRWQKQLREFEQRYQAGAVDDDERARFEARRDDEQEKELRAALGDEGFRQWDKDNNLRDLDLVKLQLSSSETDALYQLRKDRALKDRALAEALRNGEIDEADYNERQSAAQKEYDQQFKTLLGDERYEALQNSEEGMEGALRQKVKNLNPADAQFESWSKPNASGTNDERNWNAGRRKIRIRQRRTKSNCGLWMPPGTRNTSECWAQRFRPVTEKPGQPLSMLKRYANTWSLSESDIDYIYSSVQHYQEKNPHSRDQIEQSLIAYLGPERFDRLKKNDLFNVGEQ